MQGRIKLIFLLLLAVLFGRAQTISQYEYWLDADYGHRHTVATNSTVVEQSIDISSLSEGIHYLNFRAEDGDGVSGLYHRYLFMVPASEMTDATVSGYEYWIDADYAHRVSSSVTSTDITQSIDVSTLSSGIHYLNFRAKRTDGEPGLYYRYLFVVPDKEEVTLQIDQVKFWIDDDEQNSQTMKVEAGSEIAISMDISQLEAGSTHTFNINAVSIDGLETPLGSYEFTLEAPAEPEPYAVLTEVNSNPNEGTIVPNNSRAETATTSNYTLTFYYDTMKAERNGMSVGPFELPQDRGWESVAQNITAVEFDASMANDTTITSTAYWFYGCQELASITGMENLRTESVTDMKYMFYDCNELEHVDVSGFNTAKVTDMSGMFYKCHRLQELDLSNFNTLMVKNMSWMFFGCYEIKKICAGSYWTTTSVTESEEMFMNCTNLVGGRGTTYDENRIDYTFAHIDGGTSNPGYFTDKNAVNLTMDEEGYYLLGTADDWKAFASVAWNNPNANAKMIADIDLGDDQTMIGPSDEEGKYYQGTFDGQGHTLHVNLAAETSTAPIRYVKGATIENLHVTGRIEAYECSVGGIVGHIQAGDTTRIKRCWSSAQLVSGFTNMCQNTIGGIVSCSQGFVEIDDCLFDGSFGEWNSRFNGGFICNSHGGLVIRNSLNVGTYPDNSFGESGTFFRPDQALGQVELINVFYKNACGDEQGNQVNEEQLANGSVVQLLQNDRSYEIWIQGSDYPVLSYENAIVPVMEPYAVLTDNADIISSDETGTVYGKTLTIYYDNQKEARNGMSVGPFGSPNARGWHNDIESITTVVFDDSFANDTVLTSMYCWFYNCSNLTKIEGISNLHTAMVTDMTGLFSGCTKLASLDLTGFNTANVTIMYGMFQQCYSLNTIDVTNFNTAKVEDMRYMFSECSGLTTLDLSSFNVSNVTYMDELFAYCSALTTIYVGSEWLIDSEKTSGPHMFRNCQKLVGGKGTTYDSNHLHVDYAHIDGGPDNPGYFTQSGSEPYVGPKEQVATPKIQFEDEKILLTTETEDATIYYAIKPFDNDLKTDSINRLADELVVSDSSTVYQDPIYANEDFIIKAMAAKEGMENSENATYIYPYTEWQSLIQTTYVVMVRIEDATRDYTPSDALQAKIDQLKTQIAYIHEVYNHKRTEWDRDRVRAERNNLAVFGYDLETQIAVEKTESNAATYENLVLTVEGQTTMAQALEQVGGRDVVAKDIAAIVWNSTEAITRSDIEGFGNPNLLIYVQADSLAPEGVNNVVVDGKAKNIVLVDAEGNNNFYAPQEFTAESISYTREFKQTTQKDVSRGWEGVCLPFTVQTYTHESHGAIAPFRNNASDYHFWLRQMTDKGLTTAENIEANMPYIISMPNSDAYPEAYNQAGKVTFAAENAKISKSTAVGIQLADRPIIVSGTYHRIATGYYALNVGHEYEGNPEGSIFILNYREIRPFEVFTWHNGSGARSISISSLFGGEGTTDIIDVIAEPNSDRWYDMNGRRLQSKPVRKGIYIKNGKKVVIK